MLIGVVGKPSCGKSTFFKASTLSDVEIANYPFTTIKPNHAVGFVKVDPCSDKTFDKQCEPREGSCVDHKRFVPIEMLDVAGLVPGASQGQGMGNQFLDDLRQADALIHVIDVSGSTNERGEPVEKLSHDPLKDVKFLEEELDLWYQQIFSKVWDKFSRQVQQEHADVQKAIAKQFSGLRVTEELVEQGIKSFGLESTKIINWEEDKLRGFVSFLRKKTKPMIIAANKIDVPGAEENLERLKKEYSDYIIIAASSESELALKEAAKHKLIKYAPGDKTFEILEEDKLNDKQKNALGFVEKNILEKHGSTGVQEVIDKAVFELLSLIALYPVANHDLTDQNGKVMPDCFLLPSNTTAISFAYKIHTDIGDNFIRATNMKTKMAVKKDEPLSSGDVIEIATSK